MGIAYYAASRLGVEISFPPTTIAPFWPPSAILCAALCLAPPRTWPIYLLVAFPAYLLVMQHVHAPMSIAVGFFAVNSLEALVAALGLRGRSDRPFRLSVSRDLTRFVFWVALVASGVSALAGSALTVYMAVRPSFWDTLRTWFMGNLVAHLTLTPMILVWATGGWRVLRTLPLRVFLEAGLLSLGLLMTAYLVLGREAQTIGHMPAMLCAPLPFLLAAAIRLGPRGAFTLLTGITLVAIWSAMHGQGPFADLPPEEDVLNLQLFVLSLALPLAYLAILIQEHRMTETALRASEESYRRVISDQADLVCRNRPDGTILFVNEAYCRYFNRSAESLLGCSLVPYVHPEDWPLLRRHFAEFTPANPVGTCEHRVKAPTGEIRWHQWTNRAIFDASGQILEYQGVGRDVTERRAAEEALRESQQRYESLFTEMMTGFALHEVVYDDQGKPCDTRFLDVNPAFVALTGLHRENVVGRRMREVLPGVEEYWIEAFTEVALTGKPAHLENYSKSLDRYYEVTVYSPKPGQCALTFTDVTKRRRSEEERERLELQLRQSQKLEAIGRLAGGVAHDFNNLLTVILGNAESTITAMEEGTDDTSCLLALQQIQQAGARGAALTRQLLTFSRRQVSRAEVLNPVQVVKGFQDLLRRLIGEDVQLEVVAGENIERIRADAGQIEQAIMNLAINARDAMPRGGRLTIEIANALISETEAAALPDARPGPHVMIVVIDTGEGMSADTLGHVFEPFFTTKPLGKGTGLGLATVYGIVRQTGGYVTVASHPGAGTTFRLYFPSTAEPAVERDEQPKPEPLRGRETILLCEDEEMVSRLISNCLSGQGYQVLKAANGSEAIALATGHPGRIQLLITDLVMPGMNGRELARDLTAQRADTRVLYISGYAADVIGDAGTLPDDALFLRKPFQLHELLQCVRTALDAGSSATA